MFEGWSQIKGTLLHVVHRKDTPKRSLYHGFHTPHVHQRDMPQPTPWVHQCIPWYRFHVNAFKLVLELSTTYNFKLHKVQYVCDKQGLSTSHLHVVHDEYCATFLHFFHKVCSWKEEKYHTHLTCSVNRSIQNRLWLPQFETKTRCRYLYLPCKF